MKLYAYKNENGKIKKAEIDAEEKVVLVPKNETSFPFVFCNQIGKANIGKVIGYSPTIFLESPDFDYAKEKFLEHTREKLAEKEKCFKEQGMEIEELKSEIRELEQAAQNANANL